MASNNYIYKMSNAGGMSTVTRYTDMLAGNAVWNPWEPQGAYDALATVTVPSGGAASVTFAGIPTGYKHLQIRGIASSDRTGYVVNNYKMTFNGDTASNYRSHWITGGYGTTPTADASSSGPEGFIYMPTGTTSAASSVFAGMVIDVLDYANVNKNKVSRNLMGYDVNGTSGTGSYGGTVSLTSGLWMNTSAITSISLFPEGFNWIQYSQFALYGIK